MDDKIGSALTNRELEILGLHASGNIYTYGQILLT
jgi:DNA-binding CsgD family transcriptional regulator